VKELFGILLGFLPWILFGVLAGPSLPRLSLALAVALAAVLALGYKQLRRGFFLTWGSLLFFSLCLISIGVLKILWVAQHMDVLTKAALAAIDWVSIIAGQPFTLQYARQSVPAEYWHTPLFIRTGYILAIVWGVIFLVATGASLARPYLPISNLPYQMFSNGIMVLGVIFTRWYTTRVRRAREVQNRE
jgi:hypothetical protein